MYLLCHIGVQLPEFFVFRATDSGGGFGEKRIERSQMGDDLFPVVHEYVPCG